uniref:HD domain-containing protein n=1 Tax=Paractinoplanes polyasparticus TaxID=2856853 RepID=UPI001C84AB26|nr:ATP-binding protein [Actinoplanes polyasparticus]
MTDWGPLGEVLNTGAAKEDLATVERLVDRAKSLLARVPDTFPTYTLHDDTHARNVIRLIGLLVGRHIEVMRPLEAALLILAAYYHDIGMVYSADDLTRLLGKRDFRAFIENDDEAFLATRSRGGTPPPGVIERYCRSRHAERVREHLQQIDPDWLRWDGGSIIRPLELICRSHGLPARALRGSEFAKDFRGADLRFCAIMLRLADILDLDRSRAPEAVYQHLKLGRHRTAEAAASDAEWRKHLAAGGFDFKQDPPRNYALQFVADPEDPGVEHMLRTFLGVVTEELSECRAVADECNDRWRDLPLPAEIDDSAITSQGYRYGSFRFELDREAALGLFTGEQLYDDPYAFVRELLQNAFDAVSARHHFRDGHRSSGIRVHCWDDESGYVWVRVDDDGIGMDQAMLENYFLRIGKSYYQSAEFKAEVARRGMSNGSFGAISQFGIGVLSCFMVGDRLELTSLRAAAPGTTNKGIRLSINRRDDYFVFLEEGDKAKPMPGRPEDDAFLDEPGTRIAVRIDPSRAPVDLATAVDKVKQYVLDPPVSVSVNDTPCESWRPSRMHQAFAASPTVTSFDLEKLIGNLDNEFLPGVERIGIAVVPLDLAGTPECPDVQGHLLAYVPFVPDANDDSAPVGADDEERIGPYRRQDLSHEIDIGTTGEPHGTTHLEIAVRSWVPSAEADADPDSFETHAPDLESALAKLAEGKSLYASYRAPSTAKLRDDILAEDSDELRWSYNGIALPTRSDQDVSVEGTRDGSLLSGVVRLSGQLRPDLTVSRSHVRAVPWRIHSALQFALRRAASAAIGSDSKLQAVTRLLNNLVIVDVAPQEPLTAAVMEVDDILRLGRWNAEPVIRYGRQTISVDDLRSAALTGHFIEVPSTYQHWRPKAWLRFYEVLSAGLLHFFVDLEWEPQGPGYGKLKVRSARPPVPRDGSGLFRPLFAVDYKAEESLARAGEHLNARHPLTRWLLDNADYLATHFPAPFERVFRRATTEIDDVERINDALRLVARRASTIAPPDGAYLRQDENGWWWSR